MILNLQTFPKQPSFVLLQSESNEQTVKGDHVYYYKNLGYLYSLTGDYTKMKENYIEALRLDSTNDYESYYNLGYAYTKLNNYIDANKSFDKAIMRERSKLLNKSTYL